MPKQLLVYGSKTFKISVPDDAKITFGPWSPPRDSNRGLNDNRNMAGTLRVYKGSKDNILACFADVRGFRDLSMDYAEEVAVEEGATIWKSDEKGYVREDKIKQAREWIEPELPALPKKATRKGK